MLGTDDQIAAALLAEEEEDIDPEAAAQQKAVEKSQLRHMQKEAGIKDKGDPEKKASGDFQKSYVKLGQDADKKTAAWADNQTATYKETQAKAAEERVKTHMSGYKSGPSAEDRAVAATKVASAPPAPAPAASAPGPGTATPAAPVKPMVMGGSGPSPEDQAAVIAKQATTPPKPGKVAAPAGSPARKIIGVNPNAAAQAAAGSYDAPAAGGAPATGPVGGPAAAPGGAPSAAPPEPKKRKLSADEVKAAGISAGETDEQQRDRVRYGQEKLDTEAIATDRKGMRGVAAMGQGRQDAEMKTGIGAFHQIRHQQAAEEIGKVQDHKEYLSREQAKTSGWQAWNPLNWKEKATIAINQFKGSRKISQIKKADAKDPTKEFNQDKRETLLMGAAAAGHIGSIMQGQKGASRFGMDVNAEAHSRAAQNIMRDLNGRQQSSGGIKQQGNGRTVTVGGQTVRRSRINQTPEANQTAGLEGDPSYDESRILSGEDNLAPNARQHNFYSNEIATGQQRTRVLGRRLSNTMGNVLSIANDITKAKDLSRSPA